MCGSISVLIADFWQMCWLSIAKNGNFDAKIQKLRSPFHNEEGDDDLHTGDNSEGVEVALFVVGAKIGITVNAANI